MENVLPKKGLGVVGTSWISASFIQACRTEGSFDVRVLYSRTLEKGVKFADENSISCVITDYQQLLNASSIDVVYIASPNDLHYKQAKLALLAGKDVICEKPLVSNADEMDDLIAIMNKTGKIVVEAITTRHLPNFKIIQENLEKIGNIKLIRSDMSQYSSRYTALLRGTMSNVFDLEHSGGALYDLGIYPISLAISLLGAPKMVHYMANTFSNGVDLSGVFVLEYLNTKVACTFSKDSYGSNSTIIEGDLGYLQINGAPSRLPEIMLCIGNQSSNIGTLQFENIMIYEVASFASLFNHRSTKDIELLTNHSRLLAQILEEGRKSAGIKFPADERTTTSSSSHAKGNAI